MGHFWRTTCTTPSDPYLWDIMNHNPCIARKRNLFRNFEDFEPVSEQPHFFDDNCGPLTARNGEVIPSAANCDEVWPLQLLLDAVSTSCSDMALQLLERKGLFCTDFPSDHAQDTPFISFYAGTKSFRLHFWILGSYFLIPFGTTPSNPRILTKSSNLFCQCSIAPLMLSP